MQKAFDSVPHKLVVSRLRSTGVNRRIVDWVDNFLSNRIQRVRIDHAISDTAPVTSGVIQGSVLGPTLFNIFINDIDSNLEFCKILKYADDTRIYLNSSKNNHDLSDLQYKVQKDINNFVGWVNASGMTTLTLVNPSLPPLVALIYHALILFVVLLSLTNLFFAT